MSKSYNLRTAFWRRMIYLQFKPEMKNIEQVEGLLFSKLESTAKTLRPRFTKIDHHHRGSHRAAWQGRGKCGCRLAHCSAISDVNKTPKWQLDFLCIFQSLEFPNLGFFKATFPDSRLLKSPNPVSRSSLQSRISSLFSFKIPNPGLEMSQIPDPENLSGTLYSQYQN